MSNAPTLINLPPPPSEPVTPSDVPGTPNSTTTSMSELSTVAIKDGHRGHLPHHHAHSRDAPSSGGLSTQLDAERADRISRLAGLERVSTVRSAAPPTSNLNPSAPAHSAATSAPPHSYFDATGNPAIGRERSTVGSASATGSVGARTSTWGGGSEAGDLMDKMSESAGGEDDRAEDMMDTSSVGGLSEEGTGSLVGFGEGARTPARQSIVSNPGNAGAGGMGGKGQGGVTRDAKMIDGMTYDRNVVDTTSELRRSGPSGTEEAERIVRENMDTTSNDRMRRGPVPGDLGKFGFEK